MSSRRSGLVAILSRGSSADRASATPENSRFRLIFSELRRLGVAAEPAIYLEEMHEEVRAQLERADAVLVWVNPIQHVRDRSRLNALLREVASGGRWVSAHPDVIDTLGVKEVLFRTRDMGWGTDTRLYRTTGELRQGLAASLAAGVPRVLKRSRGNDGQGVWKVERVGGSGVALVRVQEAHAGSEPVEMPLSGFLTHCERYFDDGGAIVDQPFQSRLRDGMIRCYVSEDRVAGFAHQHPGGLMAPGDMHPDAQLGKLMFGPDEPRFSRLKSRMETTWIPELMARLGLSPRDMPVIWDADFLYGPRAASGEDTFVLCEINVSSVFAIPDEAAATLARCVACRLETVRA
jgi:hypothetical protein